MWRSNTAPWQVGEKPGECRVSQSKDVVNTIDCSQKMQKIRKKNIFWNLLLNLARAGSVAWVERKSDCSMLTMRSKVNLCRYSQLLWEEYSILDYRFSKRTLDSTTLSQDCHMNPSPLLINFKVTIEYLPQARQ